MTGNPYPARVLSDTDATTYADWFASLSEPTRVRLLHTVATTQNGMTVGTLATQLGISQATCSHHIRKLAEVGFLKLCKKGTSTCVTVNEACCAGLPHAADAVMGLLAADSNNIKGIPDNVTVRSLTSDDWPLVRRIYAQGIATGIATFETTVPNRASLDAKWLPDHRWVAELTDQPGEVVGWTALSPASTRDCYAGVAESAIYVSEGTRGRGIGKALIHKQVTAADEAGLWTLQTSIFTENRPSIALHHAAGYRTVGIRERIAQLNNTWHDTILIERRTTSGTQPNGRHTPARH